MQSSVFHPSSKVTGYSCTYLMVDVERQCKGFKCIIFGVVFFRAPTVWRIVQILLVRDKNRTSIAFLINPKLFVLAGWTCAFVVIWLYESAYDSESLGETLLRKVRTNLNLWAIAMKLHSVCSLTHNKQLHWCPWWCTKLRNQWTDLGSIHPAMAAGTKTTASGNSPTPNCQTASALAEL